MPPTTYDNPGAWLPWPVVQAVLRLDLKPTSRLRVFLAVLATSARYDCRDAKLGIADIADLTGLSPRTVKTALAELIEKGLVVRTARSQRLAVPMLASVTSVGPRRLFTRPQESAMRRALKEARSLLGSEPLDLPMRPEWADRLGLSTPVTYRSARGLVTADRAGVFVGSVLSLHSDERVVGRDL